MTEKMLTGSLNLKTKKTYTEHKKKKKKKKKKKRKRNATIIFVCYYNIKIHFYLCDRYMYKTSKSKKPILTFIATAIRCRSDMLKEVKHAMYICYSESLCTARQINHTRNKIQIITLQWTLVVSIFVFCSGKLFLFVTLIICRR